MPFNLPPSFRSFFLQGILLFVASVAALIFGATIGKDTLIASLQKEHIDPYLEKKIALFTEQLEKERKKIPQKLVIDPITGFAYTTSGDSTETANAQQTTTKTDVITTTTYVASISGLPTSDTGSLLYMAANGWTASTFLYHGGSAIGIGTKSPEGKLHLLADKDTVGLIVQAVDSQNAVLQEWQDKDGNVLTSVNKTGKLTFNNASEDHAIEIIQTGNAGYLSSSGGAFFLNNTDNIGTGIGIFSNAGSEALGNMINVKVDNSLYNQAAFYMNYDGMSNAVEIISNSTDTSSNALAVTGNNPNDSTVGIIGYETGRGTVKISHNGTGTDANASGISIDLKGTGTRAQGLYVDSTASSGTLGNLLRLRNQSIDKFVVNYQGNLTFAGDYLQGVNGTDTTFTKHGNTAGDEFYIGTNGAFRVQRSATNSEAFRVQINGDTQGRWLGTSDGKMKWGDGSVTQDTTLYRGGAGLLYLDGAMVINNNASDLDTVIKGDTDSNLFYVDASVDSIGIGISTPLAKLDIASSSAGVTNMLRLASTATATNNYGASMLFAARRTTSGTTNVANITGIITDITQAAYKGALTFGTSNNAAPAERMRIDNNGNIGIGITTFGTNATKVLALGNGTAPSTSIVDGIQLYAIDADDADGTSTSELFVRDEDGNATNLSPHNFSLIPGGRSESLAWSYYSEKNNLAINADMTKALRLLENISGEQLIYVKDLETNAYIPQDSLHLTGENSSPLSTVLQNDTITTLPSSEGTIDMVKKEELEEYITWQEKSLKILKDLTVQAKTIFENSVTFVASTIFKSSVQFENDVSIQGTLQLANNQAGKAIIKQGQTAVQIVFSHSFSSEPIITATATTKLQGNYWVMKNEKGFAIHVEDPQSQDVHFDWHAFVTVDVQTAVSSETAQPTPTITPTLPPIITIGTSSAVLSNIASPSAN